MAEPPEFMPIGTALQINRATGKLTCDRNGLEPGSWDREQELRAASNTVLDAASRHIAKLKERVATLEADNNVMIVRELDATVRMRHWRMRALKLACELAALKMTLGSPVKSSPVPEESSLPEPEKPSQDAIWRNATRFSR